MGKLSYLKTTGTRLMHKALTKMGPVGSKLSKHAPAIFTGVGIVGMIGGTILACKATKDSVYILDWYEVEKDECEECIAKEEDEALKAEKQSYLKKLGRETTVEVVKSYIPAVAVDVVSIGCLVQGHRIASKRLLTMTGIAANTAAQFAAYRDRVRRSENGEELDQLYLKGGVTKEIEVEKETKKGNVKKVVKEITVPNPDEHPKYSFQLKFGDGYFNKNPEIMFYTLQNLEKDLTRRLRYSKKGIVLNDLYEEMKIKDENGAIRFDQEGMIVGWIDDGTDKEISFGIDYDFVLKEIAPWNWNGDDYLWIEPNVDGVILDRV